MAIVIAILTAVEILAARGAIQPSIASVLLFGGLAVGLVGWRMTSGPCR